jgi:tetratricopeptide (TPR) repeat protein
VPILREYVRSRAFLFAGSCYLLVAIACTRVPLFNYLGFESAFAAALTGSFIAGFLTISVLRPAYRSSDADSRPFAVVRSFGSVVLVQFLLLLIPLAVLSGNALIVPNCDYLEGLAFYLLLPVVSVFFACALGLFCTVHYTHPRLVFTGYAGASVIYVLLLGYFTPAIFSYNFFYGFFPGFSYDELLPLGWPLISFRLLTVGVAVFFVWCTDIMVKRTSPGSRTTDKGVAALRALATRYIAVTMILVVLCTALYLFRCQLGWESTRTYVRAALGGRLETAHFTIYYDSAATDTNDLRLLAQEHEFRLHQVLEAFALPRTEHITSFVYPSAAVKRRLIGAGETELAKPWSGEVHITRSSVDDALKHELVHVVAAPFGTRLIKASLSPGLTEGLAVAVEGLWGYRTLEQYAAAIRAAGLAPPIGALMTPAGFMTQSSSVSYVLAGAFCRYLIDSHGMRPLLQVYNSGDYEAAYLRPLDSLIVDWQHALDSVRVTSSDGATVDVIFRRPPIFGKVCVRVHARRLREAQRLMQQHRYDEALARYTQLYAEGGSYEALSGLMAAHLRRGNFQTVMQLYDSATARDRIPRRYLVLALSSGDAHWATGDRAGAAALYTAVRSAELSPGLTEAAFVRLWALSDSSAASALQPYFVTEMSDTVRVGWLAMRAREIPDPLREYLRGRLMLRMRRYVEAAQLLVQAGTIVQDPVVEALRQVSIGDALLRAGSVQEARGWYWTSLNHDARPYAAAVVNDRLARCDWIESHQAAAGNR